MKKGSNSTRRINSNRSPAASGVFFSLAGASSGQRPSAGFPRPSHTGVWPTVTLRHWWPVPFRAAVSVTCVQGVAANYTKHPDQTHGNNAATLSTHSTPPSGLHCTARQHLRCTTAQPHGLRPPASARWEAGCVLTGVSGTLCCRRSSIRSITAEAHGQGCGLRTSIPLLPEYRHPKEPAAPTVSVSGANCGGPAAFAESLAFPLRHLSDEIRRRYGGATFEIKRCSSFSPSGIYNRYSCCSSAVNPL